MAHTPSQIKRMTQVKVDIFPQIVELIESGTQIVWVDEAVWTGGKLRPKVWY